ncbi:hypothetical protein AUP68_03159 [Ilyonectria robusta]
MSDKQGPENPGSREKLEGTLPTKLRTYSVVARPRSPEQRRAGNQSGGSPTLWVPQTNKTQLSMRQRWSRLMPESQWEALLAVRSHTSSALSPLTTASIPPSVRYIPPVPMDPALVDIRHGWSSQLSMSPMSQPTPRRPRFFAHPPSWFLDRDTSSWNPTLRVLFDVRDRGKPIRNSSKDRWEPWFLVFGRCSSDNRLARYGRTISTPRRRRSIPTLIPLSLN